MTQDQSKNELWFNERANTYIYKFYDKPYLFKPL